jgi:GMP synthase (glutamine-hydrolysing)
MNTTDFITTTSANLRAQIGNKKALCGLSGGVDSAVAAALVHRAVPGCLTCVYVDTGLMRQGESDAVEALFRDHFGIPFIRADASAQFMEKLTGITDPEQKRKIIGEAFIRVFEAEAAQLKKSPGSIECLVQGTILSDVEESAAKSLVKSHHNVGGLPEQMDFTTLIEPLAALTKDEVREVGLALGLPETMVYRQPFPGPGLAVRCIGEITPEKIDILRRADFIVTSELAGMGIWQYFAILTGVRTTGIKNGERVYGHTVAVRAVVSKDARTATAFPLPFEVLARVAERLTGEVPEVCRVVYDVTDKPCGTIEWE